MKHPKLVEATDPVLRKKAILVSKGDDISTVLADMKEVLDAVSPGCVGLAAPQIGKSLRIFITRYEEVERVFINPKIIHKMGNRVSGTEGCMSLPGIIRDVLRNDRILIEYYDEVWNRRKEIFSGFTARIIQHEQDHLNGKLIIDYVA